MTTPVLRVGLVDDQALVREGLRRLLDFAPEVDVVLEAQGGHEALALLQQVPVDVLLLDVRMPDLDGVGVLRTLRRERRLPPTLMLTTFNDEVAFTESLKIGARGFILKDISFTQLLADITTVASGGTVIRLFHHLSVAQAQVARTPRSGSDLTDREVEVLRLMAQGYSNRELGEVLQLKEGTVKNHVSSILLKLAVRDRTQAVLLALEEQLI